MTYQNALKLKPGDTISIKLIKRELKVVHIEVDEQSKDVFIHCSDGCCYHHRALLRKEKDGVYL